MRNTIYLILVFMANCTMPTISNVQSTDPTERGLSYVAVAIVISAVIRGCLN